MRLPSTLTYTLLSAAAIACSSGGSGGNAPGDASAVDAARDARTDANPGLRDAEADAAVADSPTDDGCVATIGCGSIYAGSDASCPSLVCTIDECSFDAGCEPFV